METGRRVSEVCSLNVSEMYASQTPEQKLMIVREEVKKWPMSLWGMGSMMHRL